MGSKARIAKDILPIILKNRKEGQFYVEPFVGGANSIDKVRGNTIGADINEYLIEMFKALQKGQDFPEEITRDEYKNIKNNKGAYDKCLVGYVGFNFSYSGKWFGGYAGKVDTKIGTVRNYMLEAHKNITAQRQSLLNTEFITSDYSDLKIPDNSIIYCDPPYRGTTKYKDDFNHDLLWVWCRDKSKMGHTVFVSEYNAPDDFTCVWEKVVKSSLSANGKIGSSKKSTEKLFTLIQ